MGTGPHSCIGSTEIFHQAGQVLGGQAGRDSRHWRARCPRKPQTGLARLALQRFAQGKGPPADDYSLQPGFELAHKRLLQQLPSELFVIGIDQDSEEEEVKPIEWL